MSAGLRSWVAGAVVLVLGLGAAGARGAGVGYEATGVLDASGAFDWFDAPVLNNHGTMAFTATLDSGGRGLYTVSPEGALTTIATNAGEFDRFFNPVINRDGNVAFYANKDSGVMGVYLWDGTTIHTVADSVSGMFAGGSFGATVGLNDSNTVAFGYAPDPFYGIARAIYTRGLGEPTATCIIDAATSEFQSFSDPTINHEGRVAYWAKRDGGASAASGVYTQTRLGAPRKVTDTTVFDSFFFSSGSVYPITAGADVAIYGRLEDPYAAGLYVGEGDPARPTSLETVVDERGPFAQFLTYSINDWGTVAFLGRLDDGTEGIYTGPDPSAHDVIEAGDSFMGTTIVNLFLSRQAINDHGQVAFAFRGSSGIGLATPLPEPAGVAVLVLGGVAGLLGRRRRG